MCKGPGDKVLPCSARPFPQGPGEHTLKARALWGWLILASKMNPSFLLYNLAALSGAALLPPVWLASRLSGRFNEFWPRIGLYSALPPAQPGPRVWLQAVSVGEVAVAKALADELLQKIPNLNLTITSSTPKGLEEATKVLGDRAVIAPFPLDLPWAVAAACRKIRPHVYASLETEIWPNLLTWLKNRGATSLMLNGRLSPRSLPGYQKAGPLMTYSLGHFKRLSMITEKDAERIISLGADPEAVTVDGNAKYAGLLDKVDTDKVNDLKRVFNLEKAPLLVAGSVRSGEETPVISAFKAVLAKHPQAVLAIAPRHLENSAKWSAAARAADLSVELWSGLSPETPRNPETKVVVVDAMGLLFSLYGLAKAAFVGASLVKLGGQNPMEAAVWGVPVCYGPDMDDFTDAARALEEAGASQMVENREQLAQTWNQWLNNEISRPGQAGAQVVARWSGAASKAAQIIQSELLNQGVYR